MNCTTVELSYLLFYYLADPLAVYMDFEEDNVYDSGKLKLILYITYTILYLLYILYIDVSHISDSVDDFIVTHKPRGRPKNPVSEPNRQWRVDDKVINNFIFNPYNEITGINPDIFDTMIDGSPLDFYQLIVDDGILSKIVIETNRYASQQISGKNISPHSRLNKWKDTNVIELKQFFGLLMWTGLVQLPTYELYWSNSKIYNTEFGTIMSRNRFEILLQMIHFSDNNQIDKTNRLYKLGTILDDIMINSNMCMKPGESFCIDESLIKFMGRLSFKQYIKNKRNKFGIKLFKLCIHPCYTLAVKVYCGKEANPDFNVGSKIVQELSEPFLNCGRTLVVDNWYASVELAELLNSKQTHLVGTLRTNRKSNPKEVTAKKLKKGEISSMRSSSNILVLKWRDKRELCMISSKHHSQMVKLSVRGKTIMKPKVVMDYNEGKSPIDLSDQMSAYSNPLRRCVKWYRKVVIDALLNIAVVNAHVLFTQVTDNKISITEFRTMLVENLITKDFEPIESINQIKHKLVKTIKGRCNKCYKKMVKEKGRTYSQKYSKKTSTKCEACDQKICFECFFEDHKVSK